MEKKIRIAVSGIGNRSLPRNPDTSNWLGWVELIKQSRSFQLVAAHDVSDEANQRMVRKGCLPADRVYKDLDTMLGNTPCDALLVSNPAEFHAAAVRSALTHNLHILVEKPFVTDMREGIELAGMLAKSGRIAAVVQNWRSKDVGISLREAIKSGVAGRIGHIFFRYVRNRENPAYPKYIFQEEYPLLYAMGIHHLDLFRYILGEEYDTVSGSSFKPPWSMYSSDTGLDLFLKTGKGVSVMYSGTVSSKNNGIPQESLVIEGEKGTLFNESQWCEPPLWFYPAGGGERIDLTGHVKERSVREQYDRSDRYILENFCNAIAGREEPVCDAKDGLRSICALEASRLACESAKTIFVEKI